MVGTLISGLLGYAFHFVVSRQISIPQYGELQSLLSLSIIFGVFNSALSYFTIQHTSVFAAYKDYTAIQEFTNYLYRNVFKFATALLAILAIFSPPMASILHFSSYTGFFAISLATFISTMTVIYTEILRGWGKFFLLSIIGITTAFAKFLSGAIFAFASQKAAIISFAFLIAALVNWYLAKSWSNKIIAGKHNQENTNNWKNKYFSEINIRRMAAKIFIFSLVIILVSNLDVILVKYFSTPETAGYYGAFALVGKIVLWLNLSVISVMLPSACADGHSGKRPSKKNLTGSYSLMTAIALVFLVAYYFFPNYIISLFFGKKYIFETQFLWLFGLMSFFLSLLTLEANLSFAKHDFRVIYFLAGTAILMILGVAKYHTNLQEIVIVLSLSLLLGYFAVVALNISNEKIISLKR